MNTVKKWDPMRELDNFSNRLSTFFGRVPTQNGEGDGWFTRGEWAPLVDISEDENEYLIKAELPGMEKDQVIVDRASKINSAYEDTWRSRHSEPPPRTISPSFLLVHSLAHALIRQLGVSCGYSSSSLRERLYVDDERKMAGLLIYTATPDSDGSLGGLERQGRASRIAETVASAIEALEWCSNDPLCAQDISTFSDAQNLAACHSCMMTPETSCEEFNVLLDRALLVGLPDNRSIGFFAPLLDPLSDL